VALSIFASAVKPILHGERSTLTALRIYGIEGFWCQAKSILRQYNGIPKESFPLFLSEYVIRFNYGYSTHQLKILGGGGTGIGGMDGNLKF